MTNKEWLLKEMQNMSDEKIAEMIDKDWNFYCVKTKRCIVDCTKCKLWWLKQEHKEEIKLSEAERVILENIDKKYGWIARDKNDELYVYEKKPKKVNVNSWEDETAYGYEDLPVFNHLFQFIEWEDEEPYNIEELLKSSEDED